MRALKEQMFTFDPFFLLPGRVIFIDSVIEEINKKFQEEDISFFNRSSFEIIFLPCSKNGPSVSWSILQGNAVFFTSALVRI